MKNCEFRRSVTPHFDSQAGYSSLFFFFFSLPSPSSGPLTAPGLWG